MRHRNCCPELYTKFINATDLMTLPMTVKGNYYEITAVTPEEGEVGYQTLDQQLARSIFSELMGRQLNKDGTHSVTVRMV